MNEKTNVGMISKPSQIIHYIEIQMYSDVHGSCLKSFGGVWRVLLGFEKGDVQPATPRNGPGPEVGRAFVLPCRITSDFLIWVAH